VPPVSQAPPLLVLLTLAAPALQAAPDAGPPLDALPVGAEHRALRRQAALMRDQLGTPRGWFDRDRDVKHREDLAAVERVLAEVEGLFTDRVHACQAFWLQRGGTGGPGDVHPGFFTCPARALVADDVVRAIRRRHEVERRLAHKGLDPAQRRALDQERLALQARVDAERGLEPLYADPVAAHPDGGRPPGPRWQDPAPPPTRVRPYDGFP
jgi:hypothetical protein